MCCTLWLTINFMKDTETTKLFRLEELPWITYSCVVETHVTSRVSPLSVLYVFHELSVLSIFVDNSIEAFSVYQFIITTYVCLSVHSTIFLV